MNPRNRKGLNPLLKWLWELLSLLSSKKINIPAEHRDRVIAVKNLLANDYSGMVNSVLDFAINAALIEYSIETQNSNLTKKLNNWLNEINSDLRGKVPTGLKPLAYQYFKERWKGSSLLVLRTMWEEKDGILLPTRMWFVDGENIKIEDKHKSRIIGEEDYYLYITENEFRKLPTKDEEIFVQKPFASWSTLEPMPFIIKRGIYQNLKMMELVMIKGENFLTKALEYMLVMKRGTEKLALDGKAEYTYSKTDLKEAKEDFSKLVSDAKVIDGIPTYTTNFDTDISHLVPNYEDVLKRELYEPIEKRLLASLGLIDIVQGVSSTRRESTLSPKPFISEVKKGIVDFQTLLYDIVYTIVDKNKIAHPKYFSSKLKINTSSIEAFIDDSLRDHLRSMYDKGVISKRTYSQIVGGVDFDIEVSRRKQETEDKLDDKMYPPITDNKEGTGFDTEKKNNEQNIPDDKKDPEKKNYKGEDKESKKLIDMDDIQSLAINIEERVLYSAKQQNDCISDYLNEISYKQKITEQAYSYFKLALISKAIKDFQKENGWKCDDIFNIDNYSRERTRPVFSKLPTSRLKKEELLVDGFYCLEKGNDKLVVGIRPYCGCFGIAVYSNNFSGDLANIFIEGYETFALENNFLKGEKITPQGKFLDIPEIQFEDVKLKKDKKQAIKVGILSFFSKKKIYQKNKLPFKRGLIFAGKPGTGKTLVGKALINEINNTFIWVTSGDLMTRWGDIDPKAFGRLLAMAKELAPTILFAEDIDDYLATKLTVDTIKTQMDGLDSMDGIVTVLCTNYPEKIPKTLIDRPSRFDDVIIFDLPDEGLRYEILDVHSKNIKIKERDKVLKIIAKNSEGLTGAHLKEIVVYSMLLAADANRDETVEKDFDKALDKVKETRKLIQTLNTLGDK